MMKTKINRSIINALLLGSALGVSLVLTGCANVQQQKDCCGDTSHCLSCDKVPTNMLMTNLQGRDNTNRYQLSDGRLCMLTAS